jgi:putative SOS response-associated peptidase YedK
MFMCGGMTYPNPETHQVETRRVYFPQPHAQVPVIDDGGAIHLYQWGRRSEEEDPEYDVPVTGWARANKLDSGYWQRYGPSEVLLPALKFSEKGKLPKSKWFEMPEDTYIMGLKIERKDKNFIYIVTNPAIGELEKIHPRMPLIVNADFSPADFDIEEQEEKPDGVQKSLF